MGFRKSLRILVTILFCTFFPVKHSLALNLVSDAEIEQGVRHLVSPIIRASGLNPNEVNIFIVLNDEVNAFAINRNTIFLNTGLIMLFNDANVVKGVFAHELGHVTGGHIIRREQKMDQLTTQSVVTTLLGVAAIAGGAGEAGGALIYGSGHGLERSMLRFTRENEYSADQAAFKYLRLSENSPEGLLKVLKYFDRKGSGVNEKEYQYMITHPLTKERIFAAMRLDPWKLDATRNQQDQLIFSRVYAKLHGFLDDPKLTIEKPLPSLDEFSKKYMDAIAYYRLNEFSKSLELLDNLIKQSPNDGYLYELKAQFLFELGRVKEAIPMYEKAVALDLSDDLIKLEYAVAMISVAERSNDKTLKNSYYRKAIKLLHIVVANQPNNAWAFRNLAIAYGRVGEIGASNLMLAEEALLYGKSDEAEEFVTIAKQKGLNNHLQLRAEDIIKSIAKNK